MGSGKSKSYRTNKGSGDQYSRDDASLQAAAITMELGLFWSAQKNRPRETGQTAERCFVFAWCLAICQS